MFGEERFQLGNEMEFKQEGEIHIVYCEFLLLYLVGQMSVEEVFWNSLCTAW